MYKMNVLQEIAGRHELRLSKFTSKHSSEYGSLLNHFQIEIWDETPTNIFMVI